MNPAPMPEGFFPPPLPHGPGLVHGRTRWGPAGVRERVRGVRLWQRLLGPVQILLQPCPSACAALSEEVTSKGFISH